MFFTNLWAKISGYLVAAGTFVLAVGVFALYVWRKATRRQADKDKARRADEAVEQAQAAGDTFKGASAAAGKVREEAKKQSPPDPVGRDDFDNTF